MMNLHQKLLTLRHRRGVARFPFGQPGDPLLTMLPPHSEAVAVQAIMGSVDRSTQLDYRFQPRRGPSHRFKAIRLAMTAGETLPPIQVYRLHGVCYVIDGHNRVAAALAVGQLYLDAMVTECIVTGDASAPALEEVRVGFALRTGLRSLSFSAPERYDQALAQIQEHRWYMCEHGPVVSLQEAAADWYDTVYLPVARHLIAERLAPAQSPQVVGDLYLHLCDLKYGVSRERGHDIGFAQAIREWAAQRRRRTAAGRLGRAIGLSAIG